MLDVEKLTEEHPLIEKEDDKKESSPKSHFENHWPVWIMFAILAITDIFLIFVPNPIAAIFVLVAGVTVAQGMIDFYQDRKYKPVWSLCLRLLALVCAALILWLRGWQ